MSMPDTLRQRVLQAAATEAVPTRLAWRRQALVAIVVAAVASLGLFECAGGAEHGKARPGNLTLWIALGGSLLAVIATWLAHHRGRSMLGRPMVQSVAVAVLAPVATAAWMVAFADLYTAPAPKFGWRCLGLSLAMTTPLLIAGWRYGRPQFGYAQRWQGAAIGGAAAAWAAVLVQIWCPLCDLPHVLVGHALPVALAVLVGALLAGKRI